jgi:hypothetical protein
VEKNHKKALRRVAADGRVGKATRLSAWVPPTTDDDEEEGGGVYGEGTRQYGRLRKTSRKLNSWKVGGGKTVDEKVRFYLGLGST